jgi:hypothetical protein
MDEYTEVKNNQFQLLKPGDFIRWKTQENEMSMGAAIYRVGRGKTGPFWTMKGKKPFVLVWENLGAVFVRKTALFEILDRKITVLSNIITFLIKQLDLDEEMESLKGKLKKTALLEDRVKTQRAKEKRRTKSVPPIKKKLNN